MKHATPAPKYYSTEELAALFRVAHQTPRAALCRNGHYLGMRPIKLPNGRLLWNAADAACVLNEGA